LSHTPGTDLLAELNDHPRSEVAVFEDTRRRTFLILLGAAAFSIHCGGDPERQPVPDTRAEEATSAEAPGFQNITVEQLHEMIANGDPFLVNVHIPFEGDIPGTDESIPFDEIQDHLDRLPRDRGANIILYCRSDRMSTEAAETLVSLGFTNVSNLEGGFRAWESAGYEILK
jgi:rhodanese-related sulfurtransferase